MKRLFVAIAFLLAMAVPSWGAVTCPANVTGVSPSATSCWPLNETSGTTITDTIGSNSGTLSGSYTLTGDGIYCNGSGGGCSITTPVSYSNPQPMSVIVSFAGTQGALLQVGSTSSASAPLTYYELYLGNDGRLTFGVNNYGAPNIIRSPNSYADGNTHVAMATLGAAGMKLYVDGVLVASRAVTMANYAAGDWFFGGMNTAGWPLAPGSVLGGTLYYVAWWNGTQLSDAQAELATINGGATPTPIANVYCTITGQFAGLNPGGGYAYANQILTFHVLATGVPACTGAFPLVASTMKVTLDGTGSIPSGTELPQGAHVLMSIGFGQPAQILIPCSSSVNISTLLPAS